MVDFGILGPVQAVREGRVLGLGGPKPRAVLALLLVAAGRVVPAERLVEELWGGCPPPAAAGTLRAHVQARRRPGELALLGHAHHVPQLVQLHQP